MAICSSSGQQIGHRRDLLLEDQDQRLVEDGPHLLGLGDEIRREIAAIEPHAFHQIDRGLGALGFLDRGGPLDADPLDGVSHLRANRRVVVGGHGGDLHALRVLGHGA